MIAAAVLSSASSQRQIGYAQRHRAKEAQNFKRVNLLKQDQQRAMQFRRAPQVRTNNLMMEVEEAEGNQVNLLNADDKLCIDFQTFL